MKLNIDRKNWKKVKLGDVAFEYSKRINNPSESEFDRFVSSSNIAQWDFRVKSWESTSSVTSAMKLFEPDDYLLVRRSLYASDFRERAPRAHFSGVCSGDILTIKENRKFIADGFLIGILNSPALWKYVVANGSGSITRRIHWKDLANYEFLLPPKAEQARLAELLWAMDELIEKEKGVLDKIILIKNILSDNYFNPNKHTDKLVTIGKVSKLTAGGTPSTEKKEYWEGGDIPWLSSGEVHKKIIHYTDNFITARGLKNSSAKLMPSKTIFIALAGQGKTKGTVAISEIETCTNQSVAAIIPNIDSIEPYYLYYNLDSRYLDFRHITGKENSRTGLNLKILNGFKIVVHDKMIRKKILDEFIVLDENIDSIEYRIKNSQSLQKSLINQIF
jgi:type I restriction enzyme S subunit